MSREKKLKSPERRGEILTKLRDSSAPITGKSLAEEMNVTRQVIVADVSLLKAGGEPIIATSQGYLYMKEEKKGFPYTKTIVCCHNRMETKDELEILVDHGVYVQNVVIEHPVYGDLKAELHLGNRRDVERFMERVNHSNASFLLELTGGVHTHEIAAGREDALHNAIKELEDKGIIVK
ncbi:transcription repressor NadR [Salimicrobium sp. PL1-032A]|uniref:transcription repressor NadR n=1 Tax=Salimicrobium sp. PL1-032A TaxID=3095364 RepID=UPI00325FE9FD